MADKPGVAPSFPDHSFDNDGNLTATGTANTYAVTTGRKIFGYYKGLRICVRIPVTNTGASTLAVDEASAIAIRKAGNTALAAGDLVGGVYYDFIYDDANNVLQVDPTFSATTSIASSGVTFTNSQRVLGRSSAGSGSGQELTLSQVLDFVGSAAQGDILYRDSSAWNRLPAGTNRQFLQTQGASANPQWASVGSILLLSGTVSSATSLDLVLTNYTSFRALQFVLSNFIPVTNDVELWLRYSTDGGNTYITTASYAYAETGIADDGGGRSRNSGADSKIILCGGTSAGDSVSNNATLGGADVILNLMDQSLTSRYTKSIWQASFVENDPRLASVVGTGHYRVAQDTDAVRFMFETGNISSGKYSIYGLT